MIDNCLLNNRKNCSKRNFIQRYKSQNKILIVYGYDWGYSSDTPALIYEFIERKINPLVKELNIELQFEKLGGEEGSVYCGICQLIQKADIALFDITTNNLNVILELGLAIGSGAHVYPLRSKHKSCQKNVLSDLNGILEYRFTRRGGKLKFETDLEKDLLNRIRYLVKEKNKQKLTPEEAFQEWRKKEGLAK